MKAEAAEKKKQKQEAEAEENEEKGEDGAEGGKKKAKKGGGEQQKQPDGDKPGQVASTGPQPNAANSNSRHAEPGQPKDAVPAAAEAGRPQNTEQIQSKPTL